MVTEHIIVFSAHSDDFVIGAGGTIAKYVQEKKKVHAIVLSYGEKSHPWLRKAVIKSIRAEEAKRAARVLGCSVHIFDLKEFSFLKDVTKGPDKQLARMLLHWNPIRIFTHSSEDPHPDHHASYQITMRLIHQLKKKPEVYVYSVWNPVSFRTRFPALYQDVTATFQKKLQALREFPSQRIHIIYPLIILLYRAIKDGIKVRGHFGEHFFRIQ